MGGSDDSREDREDTVATAGDATDGGVSVCSSCGRTEPGPPPLTWTVDRQGRREAVHCEACSREHVRSIEARLDQEWW